MSVTVRDLNIAIGGAPIVRGVDLDIADAQRVGLVGASGSGKSMISKAMLGLLPTHAVVSGSVVMGGMETVGTDDRRLADIRGRYCRHGVPESGRIPQSGDECGEAGRTTAAAPL